MKRYCLAVAVLAIGALTAAALAAAAAQSAQRTTIGKITIVANEGMEFSLAEGIWTATKGVTITADGTKVTADSVRLWLKKGGPDLQRAEAKGNVHVTGSYAMARPGGARADWAVEARAGSASYDGGSRSAVLRGNVDLRATNTSTGEVVAAQADKASYDGKTQRFRFERAGQPVRLQWQESQAKAAGK